MVVETVGEAVDMVSASLDWLRSVPGMKTFVELMEAEVLGLRKHPDQQELVCLPALDPIKRAPTLCQHQVDLVSTPTFEPDTILTPTLEDEREAEGSPELISEIESELVSEDDLVSTQCHKADTISTLEGGLESEAGQDLILELPDSVSTPTQHQDDTKYRHKLWAKGDPPWGWYRSDRNILHALNWLEGRGVDPLTVADPKARELGVFGAKLAAKRKAKKLGVTLKEYVTGLLEGAG